MAEYTHVNLKDDVEDSAPKHGMAPDVEARFASGDLGMERAGISYQRLAPNVRLPFGHRHKEQEEVYVILGGGGRMKLEDDVVELRAWDAVRVPPQITRSIESGPEGVELLAFGAPRTGSPGADAEPLPGWWED